jgi:hypothetical protein
MISPDSDNDNHINRRPVYALRVQLMFPTIKDAGRCNNVILRQSRRISPIRKGKDPSLMFRMTGRS